jgi:hypothetical protein
MNDLYTNEFCQLTNFFCPTMKLAEKKRAGAKIVKKHTTPQTPAQRLLNHPAVEETTKARLCRQQDALNPFELRDTIQIKPRRIFKLLRYPHF